MSMLSATSQPSDEVENEFSDGDVDWDKVGSVADAAQEVQAAAEREEKITGLIVESSLYLPSFNQRCHCYSSYIGQRIETRQAKSHRYTWAPTAAATRTS